LNEGLRYPLAHVGSGHEIIVEIKKMTLKGPIIAVDGGGSKTRGWLARGEPAAPEILAEGCATAANVHTASAVELKALLDRLFGELLTRSRLRREQVGALSLAMAGSDSPADQAKLAHVLKDLGWNIPVALSTDARATLVGATAGAGGILLIAGTGSIAYGYVKGGASARSGGWGPAVGDEGAGYRLGWEALVHATHMLDGRTRLGALLDHISEELLLDSPAMLGAWIRENGSKPQEVARISTAVTRAAAAGDPVARRILALGARQLVRMVKSVRAALRLGPDFRLVLHGGMLVGNLDYGELVRAELTRAFPRCLLSNGTAEDVLRGCLQLAAEPMQVGP
jgi:N-acetylmuramic acid 6-phosphate etherase